MEKFATLLIPVLIGILFYRLLMVPMCSVFKIGIHSGCGFLCLWLLNSISVFTGILFPINAVTVLIAGFGGLPGMGIMAVLAVI